MVFDTEARRNTVRSGSTTRMKVGEAEPPLDCCRASRHEHKYGTRNMAPLHLSRKEVVNEVANSLEVGRS
jgi:hypothetical protein